MSSKPCYVLHSPFVFARGSLGIEHSTTAVGTLFFVAHSTPSIDAYKPVEVYDKEIRALPERYHPVTVCLHIHDVRKGVGEQFAALGYPVVTAGDSLDQRFTERFYRILSNYKYVVSDLFGSYALYATEMGIPFGLYGMVPEYENKCDPNVEQGVYRSYRDTPYYKRAVDLFDHLPTEAVTPEQLEFVTYHLGIETGVSRAKMASILYKSLISWLIHKLVSVFRAKHQNKAVM